MRIPFLALRAFVEVVESGSFTKAANNLFITQPAVSKSVKELEALFEIQLIDRAHNPILLTEAGTSLYKLGKSIFNIENAIIQDLSQRSAVRKGSLYIGASTTIASHWLTPFLVTFANQFPEISVSVLSGNSQQIVEQLKACQIDVGLIEGPVINEPDVSTRQWKKERLVLVASPDLLIKNRINDLTSFKWVMRENGSGTARVTDEYLQRFSIIPQSIIRVGNNLAVLDLVCSGLGIALLPEIMIRERVELNQLTKLTTKEIRHSPFIERELNWITLNWRTETPVRRVFQQLLFNESVER
ncbi:MAG: LysR family transcriptional regulator [Betaproteobacteria bacterium]|nr:LysR family transcriptional regulator [Betaproteobacteria bacterium]